MPISSPSSLFHLASEDHRRGVTNQTRLTDAIHKYPEIMYQRQFVEDGLQTHRVDFY